MVVHSIKDYPYCLSVFTTDSVHSIDKGQLTLFKQRLFNSIEKCIHSNEGEIQNINASSYFANFKTASDAVYTANQIKRKSKYNLTSINKEISDIELVIFEFSEIPKSSQLDKWIGKFVIGKIVITNSIKKAFYRENKNLKLDEEEIKVLRSKDFELVKSLFSILERDFRNSTLNIQTLFNNLNINYSKLYSVCSRLMNRNPSALIRDFRLLQSLPLLERNNIEIRKVASSVGFSQASYFSKSFKNCFGILPSKVAH